MIDTSRGGGKEIMIGGNERKKSINFGIADIEMNSSLLLINPRIRKS